MTLTAEQCERFAPAIHEAGHAVVGVLFGATIHRAKVVRGGPRTTPRGYGGFCMYDEFDFATEFIELAGKVNQDMPRHCVHQIERALNDASKSVRGAKVLVLGVSYKKGVGDIRESPALKIIDLLHERGAQVVYHDEFVPELPACGLVNTPSLDDALEGVDLSVVVTAHPNVDFAEVVRRSPATVDFRGVTRHLKGAAVPSA